MSTPTQNPPLARALHKEVEIGQMIPDSFFAAVAEVLAFVYRMKGGDPRNMEASR